MSQWGARGRAANKSESFDQILRHYYTGTTVSMGSVANDLRVLITENQPTITLRTTGPTVIGTLGTVGAGATLNLTSTGASVAVSGSLNGTIASPLQIHLASTGGPVAVTPGFAYRYGLLTIRASSDARLRVTIESLSMQQYLAGLAEMPSSWPAEAMKAQATAARTYAQKQVETRRGKPAYANYDLNSTLDGAYKGTAFESEPTNSNWVSAVNGSNGMVIRHNGALIDAVYSASSGGRTTESETAWVATVPYLRSVDDADDLTGGNPHANWSRTFSAVELGQWLGVGTMTSMRVLSNVPPSGHLDKAIIELAGTTRTRTVTGSNFRATINANADSARQLKSTRFTLPKPSVPTTPPPTAPPPTTPAKGQLLVATVDQRRIIIAGDATDPDGSPMVRVVETIGTQQVTRDYYATNGKFLVSWIAGPGNHNVCVTLYDIPTWSGSSLGCKDLVVK